MRREASDLSRAAVCAEADDGRRVFGRVERLEILRVAPRAESRVDVPSRPVGSRRVLVFLTAHTRVCNTNKNAGWLAVPAERNTPRGVRRGPLTPLRRRASRGSRSADRGESSGAADRERGPGARARGRARRWSLGRVSPRRIRASFVSAKGGHRPEETGTPPREFDSPATTRAFARRPRPRARPRSRARSGFGSGSSARAPSLGASAPRARRGRLLARGGPSSLLDPRSSPARGIHTSGVFCV